MKIFKDYFPIRTITDYSPYEIVSITKFTVFGVILLTRYKVTNSLLSSRYLKYRQTWLKKQIFSSKTKDAIEPKSRESSQKYTLYSTV